MKTETTHTYELHWLDGKVSTCTGETIAQAFSAAGYGAGAIAALDYYKQIS